MAPVELHTVAGVGVGTVVVDGGGGGGGTHTEVVPVMTRASTDSSVLQLL